MGYLDSEVRKRGLRKQSKRCLEYNRMVDLFVILGIFSHDPRKYMVLSFSQMMSRRVGVGAVEHKNIKKKMIKITKDGFNVLVKGPPAPSLTNKK